MKSLKYIFLLPVLIFALGIGIQSCSDNTDFSKPHILTDDEMAELARQQRVRDSLMQVINADTIIIYDFNLTISNGYDGGFIALDLDALAKTFNLSREAVWKGLFNTFKDEELYFPGAPEFTPFVIENTTHADNLGPQTQVGDKATEGWGHWFNDEGDVCVWADANSAIYTSTMDNFGDKYDEENLNYYMMIGQFPGKIYDGQDITIMEALKYTDPNEVTFRAVFVINVHVGEKKVVEGAVIGEETLYYENVPMESGTIEFDVEKIMKALGVSSFEELDVLGLNPDGSVVATYTSNAGYWYNANNEICTYGNGHIVAFEYYGMFGDAEDPEDEYTIYLFFGETKAGDHFMPMFYFTGNDQRYQITLDINISGYEDPETPPAGNPEDATVSIEMSKAWDNTYSGATYDVKEILRNAFKMTTYQIFQAIKEGEIQAWIEEVGDEAEGPSYTGNASVLEYWLGEDGKPASYGDGYIFLGLNTSYTELKLNLGNHPENCPENFSVPVTYILVHDGTKVTLNVNVTVGEGSTEGLLELKGEVAHNASTYDAEDVPVNISSIMNKIGASTWEDINWFGVKADGTYISANTNADAWDGRDNGGFWFNSDGYVDSYGSSPLYVCFPIEENVDAFSVGQMPGMTQPGDVYVIHCGASYGSNELLIDFKVTIGEATSVSGEVIDTKTISADVKYNADYVTTEIPFDFESIISQLGAFDFKDVQYLAVDSNGSYAIAYDAGDELGNQGFWFNQEGFKGSWGNEASVYVCFPTDEFVNAFTIAPMPDTFIEGDKVTVHCGAEYGGKIIMFDINVTMVK